MNKNTPVYVVDQWTFVAIAFFGAWGVAFSSDDAAKYMAPQVLFWLKSGCAAVSGSLLALKMFRSTAFAAHQDEKKKEKDETAFFERRAVMATGPVGPTGPTGPAK